MARSPRRGILFAYGATEPEAGSDLAALKTTAKPVTDNGTIKGYTLNGAKQWISNGGVAEFSTVLAPAPGGPSWFVVERERRAHPRRPREQARHPPEQHRGAVPGRRLRGRRPAPGRGRGPGFQQAQMVFGYTRLMVAAFGLGAGWSALDRAIPYSARARPGGGPLARSRATRTS